MDDVIPLQTCYSTSPRLPHTCFLLNQGLQGHNFKHKEPQGYSDIYLTDIYSSGSLDDIIPLQTCYSTFCRLPHICYIQNQGYQSHYFKHKELHGYSCIYFTDIECSGLLDNVTPSQTFYFTFFAISSYLLPLNQGFQSHNFKHKEPQGYSNIYLTDIYSSGSLDDGIPLQICYSTFCRLPHICCIQNQGYRSHYFKHKELHGYSCIYFTDIECSGLLDNVTPSQTFYFTFFAISSYLLPLNQGFQKSQFQTQGTSRVF